LNCKCRFTDTTGPSNQSKLLIQKKAIENFKILLTPKRRF
jgi:hypothetical protein